MFRQGRLLIGCVVLASLAASAFAQQAWWDKKNELGVLVESSIIRSHAIVGTLPPPLTDNRINFSKPWAFQGNYAYRMWTSDLFAVNVEVPFVYQKTVDMISSNDLVPKDYKAFFVTPGVRIHLFPNTLVSPWGSFGGGFGRFMTNKHGVFDVLNVPGKSTTASVFEFGVGLDVKVWRNFKLRGEARDFYSGVPDLNVNQGRSRFHNVTGGGGIVWMF
jgi:hypothetical protein